MIKSFSHKDQLWFSLVSGDWNPAHSDFEYARRTLIGEPIVHGVHALFWVLNEFFILHPERTVTGFRAQFLKPIKVNQALYLNMKVEDPELPVRIKDYGSAEDLMIFDIKSEYGKKELCRENFPSEGLTPEKINPKDTQFKDLHVGMDLQMNLVMSEQEEFREQFPELVKHMRMDSLVSLCAVTRAVGMGIPGLNSMILNMVGDFWDRSNDRKHLHFEVQRLGKRANYPITIFYEGPGLQGSVQTLFRPAPVSQPSILDLSEMVSHNQFKDQEALIIGGSRGIGEVVAKLIAAGGGQPLITYSKGEEDARRVVEDIQDYGVSAKMEKLTVGGGNWRAKLENILRKNLPTTVYYFASPKIGKVDNRDEGEMQGKVQEFKDIYYYYFEAVCEAAAKSQTGIDVFYPSTTMISTHPDSTYVHYKKAGELVCKNYNAEWEEVYITASPFRIPPLQTDQTNTLHGNLGDSVAKVILPMLIEFHDNPPRPMP